MAAAGAGYNCGGLKGCGTQQLGPAHRACMDCFAASPSLEPTPSAAKQPTQHSRASGPGGCRQSSAQICTKMSKPSAHRPPPLSPSTAVPAHQHTSMSSSRPSPAGSTGSSRHCQWKGSSSGMSDSTMPLSRPALGQNTTICRYRRYRREAGRLAGRHWGRTPRSAGTGGTGRRLDCWQAAGPKRRRAQAKPVRRRALHAKHKRASWRAWATGAGTDLPLQQRSCEEGEQAVQGHASAQRRHCPSTQVLQAAGTRATDGRMRRPATAGWGWRPTQRGRSSTSWWSGGKCGAAHLCGVDVGQAGCAGAQTYGWQQRRRRRLSITR